jgi:hypothetical protein
MKPGYMAGSALGAKVANFDYRSVTSIEVNKKMTTAVIEVIAAGYQGVYDASWWTSQGAQSAAQTSNCLPIGQVGFEKWAGQGSNLRPWD